MTWLQAVGIQPRSRVDDERSLLIARRLLQRLDSGDYVSAESVLAQANDQSRERLLYGVAAAPEGVPLAARWAAAKPSSAFAHVQLGAALIVSGWKVRGNSYAEDVDTSAWAPFLDKLKDAEEPLHRAAQLDRTLAEPYSWLIHSGIGQGAPPEQFSDLFAKACERVPLHWPAHYKYFLTTTEKWGGSHREMFAFVRSLRAAPAGQIVHCLSALAFCELALAVTSERSLRAATLAVREPQHAKDVAAALYAWLGATPEDLTTKLERVSGAFSTFALNHFAVACHLCGAEAEARAVIVALQAEIESLPWCWFPSGARERLNPAFVHDRVCRELGIAPAQ